jgi:hypothetical protein
MFLTDIPGTMMRPGARSGATFHHLHKKYREYPHVQVEELSLADKKRYKNDQGE